MIATARSPAARGIAHDCNRAVTRMVEGPTRKGGGACVGFDRPQFSQTSLSECNQVVALIPPKGVWHTQRRPWDANVEHGARCASTAFGSDELGVSGRGDGGRRRWWQRGRAALREPCEPHSVGGAPAFLRSSSMSWSPACAISCGYERVGGSEV